MHASQPQAWAVTLQPEERLGGLSRQWEHWQALNKTNSAEDSCRLLASTSTHAAVSGRGSARSG